MTLIEKELKTIISGPKFVITFTVCAILILLSILMGIQEYRVALKSHGAATQLVEQKLQEQRNWERLSTQVYREPNPMSIFVSGVTNDIGRFSLIQPTESIKLTNSAYSDDPIFALFRFIDFSFIVQIVLSLFAILFTYDAINGERENGTLKLTLANAVSKVKYILAKFAGSWLGIVPPVAIPVLLGLLLIIAFRIPFTSDHWIKLMMLFFVSLLYFTFFIACGILISALTKRSAVSFLLLLLIWVGFVLIVPRIGIITASKLVPVPSIAEIDGQIDGYAKARWDNFSKELVRIWRQRTTQMEGLTPEKKEAYRDDHLWEWMQEEDDLRKAVQVDIDEFSRKVLTDLRHRKAVQERLAFTLSRFSPASAYQLSTMTLAATDIHLKSRYETALEEYKHNFLEYTSKKQGLSDGGGGGIRISIDSETGLNIDVGQNSKGLDLSDMPRFQHVQQSLAKIIPGSIIDILVLVFYCLACLSGAFIAFLKYDVR